MRVTSILLNKKEKEVYLGEEEFYDRLVKQKTQLNVILYSIQID
jgi:hypothetical protein